MAESLDAKTLFGIAGKSVLVTGGGQGIGYMIAKAYISNDAKHVMIAFSVQVLDSCRIGIHQFTQGGCL